jgi:hypothetical protein
MINVLCNNFSNKETHWHALINKDNLKGIRALINSNLCNIYQEGKSLIIEVPALMGTMKEVERVYKEAISNKEYKVVFADKYNYCKNFTI